MTPKQTPLLLLLLCLLTAAALRIAGLADPLPPLQYDEAVNGLWISERANLVQPTAVYREHGLDSLFLYPAAALARLIGHTPFSLRLTAVFLSLLSLAAAYPLGRALGLAREAALLAVGLLAASFWPLLISRYGLGMAAQPLLITAACLALFRGWRRRSPLWLIAAAPLLALLIAHFYRQLSIAPGPAFAAEYGRALTLLFLSGDPAWQFNLPGQPIFNWFWGGLLIVGAVFLAQKGERDRQPLRLTAVTLLLLFPFIALLPVALRGAEMAANGLAVGLLPLTYYLPAYGLYGLLRKLAARRAANPAGQTAGLNRLSQASLIIILVMVGLPTVWSYFGLWRPSAELFAANEGDLTAVARYLNENPPLENERLFLAASPYPHPTIQFLNENHTAVDWLPQGEALVWPGEGGARIIYTRSSPVPDWARPLLASAAAENGPIGPDGEPDYVVYRLTERPIIAPPHMVNANFGDMATLIGYQVGGGAAGESLPLRLYWQLDRPPPAGFQPTATLADENGRAWGQTTLTAYPVEQWRAGDLIALRAFVPIPAGTPPGYHWLRVSLINPASGLYLPLLNDGRYGGEAVAMQTGMIAASGAPPPAPPQSFSDKQAAGLQLLGYARENGAAYAGQRLDLALWWRATRPLAPMTIRLELIRADGTGIILRNSQPVDGRYPFDQWQTPQFIIDRQSPRLPADLPAAVYQLQLRLLDAADRTLFTADLGPLTVAADESRFTPPPSQFPQAALFGGTIRLLGYDLQPLEDGSWELDLIWQATRATAVDYTAVVQLRDRDDSCCLWQQERPLEPGGTVWLAEEVVRDSYRLTPPPDLPPGFYPLGVQLAIGATGQRLLVVVPGLPDDETAWLRPLPVD
jgi:hypothetical protein